MMRHGKRLFLTLLIILMSLSSLSYAEKISPGCADDLDQDALKTVRQAMSDYWIKEKAWDAAKRLEEALAQEPRLHYGYDILKIFYCFHQKKCPQAVAILRKGIKHCPDYPGHNYGLAEVYVKMGKHAEALANYKIAKDKGYPVIDYFYFKVAESHFALKQIDEAIENLRKVLELNEKYFIARQNLIGLLYGSQNKQEALEQARKLVALKPDAKTLKWAKGAVENMSR
ncbi:MAG: hypothetical protein COB49_05315 [Alphaproteobacteria bacterium]|nr:MAG: hypothetical protein COB49_05315 [Alphaproteobacteria bacterium]